MGAAEKLRTGKLDGECNDDLFWEEVERIGWGKNGKCPDHDQAKRELLHRWTPVFARSFHDRLGEALSVLGKAISKWERGEEKTLECGDDGYSDLTHHVVGLGKAFYKSVVADPSIAYTMSTKYDYVESFAYCIPYAGHVDAKLTEYEAEEELDEVEVERIILRRRLGDWAQVEIETYKLWAQDNLDGYRAALAHPMSEPILSDLGLAIDLLKPLIQDGDFRPLLAKQKKLDKALKRIEEHVERVGQEINDLKNMLSYWSMKNMCTDIESYLA